MFENWLQRIREWFRDRSDRRELLDDFNRSAREAWICGIAPVSLKASVSSGESQYRHQYSKWLASGFRITAFSGKQLAKQEIISLGDALLADSALVRRLVVLGWDTLEIQCDYGNYGCKWQLRDFLTLGPGQSSTQIIG